MDFENAVLARSGTEGKMSQMMQQIGEGGNVRVKVTISSWCLKGALMLRTKVNAVKSEG